MDLEAQKRAPIYEALERFRKKRVVPFDVPGHKRGRGNPELAALLGEKCVGLDERNKGDFGRTGNNPLASFTPESVENLRKST